MTMLRGAALPHKADDFSIPLAGSLPWQDLGFEAEAPPPSSELDAQQTALVELGLELQAAGYRFTTGTPFSHHLVNSRPDTGSERDLRDIFGWSRSFKAWQLPPRILWLLKQAGMLNALDGGWYRSGVRYSTLDDFMLVHSAYPTVQQDAVFFGPDTYRFASLIRHELRDHRTPVRSLVDVGCGTGVGGLLAAQLLDAHSPRLILADINDQALRLSAVNAALAGFSAECVHSDLLRSIVQPPDLILCNPPYLVDASARSYRNGGGPLGCDLAARLVMQSIESLASGGRLILYTGAPIIAGEDMFRRTIQPLLNATGIAFDYVELDPDVFGEELRQEPYRDVERIAAIGLILRMP